MSLSVSVSVNQVALLLVREGERVTVDTGVVVGTADEELPVDYLGLRHWRWLCQRQLERERKRETNTAVVVSAAESLLQAQKQNQRAQL